MTNANNLRFRCHMIGAIMPADNARKLFTDTQIDKLVEIYTDLVEHRKEPHSNKYFEKGTLREEDGITLLARVSKRMFTKNVQRISNEFLSGEPDLFTGPTLQDAHETIDTKCSWSRITFNKSKAKDIDKNYLFQGHSYMALTGAKKHTVAHCLVNNTSRAILQEKNSLSYKPGMLDSDGNESESFREQCKQIEINHIFDLAAFMEENPYFEFRNNISEWRFDIPKEDRVHLKSFNRDEAYIQAIYRRIAECRTWMNENLFKYSVMLSELDQQHNAVIITKG